MLAVSSSKEPSKHVLNLLRPKLSNPFQIWNFPGEIFDNLHPTQQFLEQLRPLVRPLHTLPSQAHEPLHNLGLERRTKNKERIPRECAGSQIDDEKGEADGHLYRREERDMQKATAEVDARDVSGDVVDEFAVGEGGAGARGESEGAVVDGCDESSTNQDTSRCRAVKVVVLAKGGKDLHA